MALSLQQIRDYVRTALDLELEDLPDSLLDIWVREGSKRIERAETRWPFYETIIDWAVSPVDSGVYPMVNVATDLDQVASIYESTYGPLKWVGTDVLDQLKAQGPTATGRPVYYSTWGTNILFYPALDAAYALSVRGYRRAADWVSQGSGAVPDMPEELHNTIATWALSKAYAQQEDPELAALYERQFSDELNEMRRRLVVAPPQQPLVGNSGALRNDNNLLIRPRFDWELAGY